MFGVKSDANPEFSSGVIQILVTKEFIYFCNLEKKYVLSKPITKAFLTKKAKFFVQLYWEEDNVEMISCEKIFNLNAELKKIKEMQII